jgi:hypothetical protein
MVKSLIIGNPSIDILDGNINQPGGPVAFVANTLTLMGHKKIEIISSFAEDYPMKSFDPKIIPIKHNSESTTKFNTYYKKSVRYQNLESKASKLNLKSILNKKILSDMVFFAPTFDEIKISDTVKIVENNNNIFFVSLPQGWIRKLNGKKIFHEFSSIKSLPFFDIIFFSEEEIISAKINKYDLLNLAKILVITNGENGSTIFFKNKTIKINPFQANTIDSIGAGDIYAAVFSSVYYKTKSLIIAGEQASRIASKSTEYKGLKSVNSKILI